MCDTAIATVVVGVLGFIGIIVTLIVNAWLVRRERQETLKQERTAMRTALVEELKILKLSLENGIEAIEKAEQDESTGRVIVPTDTISDVYNAFVPKIGMLTSQEVGKVILAYLTIQELSKNLILLPGATILDEHRVHVPRNSFAYLIEMQKSVLPKLDDAIKLLSRGD